jgi:hypothetical protein
MRLLLDVRTSVFIPASAVGVRAELEMAGAEVIVRGIDYADALLAAQEFCTTKLKTWVLCTSGSFSYTHLYITG